jgi:hypothetical protein
MILASCGQKTPNEILKENSDVIEFIKNHPDAEISITRIEKSEIADEIESIRKICSEKMKEKEYYKATITEQDSTIRIIAFLDYKTLDLDCVRKQNLQDQGMPDRDAQEYQNNILIENSNNISLTYVIIKNQVSLSWTPYVGKGFKYYKVMRINDNNETEINKITDRVSMNYAESFNPIENKYKIIAVTENNSIESNTIEIK